MLDDVTDSSHPKSLPYAEEGHADTPRTGNVKGVKKRGDSDRSPATTSGEVDAYEKPTELFQWINYGNYQAAASHAMSHPSEVKTWIVSRKLGTKGEYIIKWRYLPLHVASMMSNPSEELLRALIVSYPSAAKERDYNGNLPIHYLLSEGCEDKNIIEMMLKANPESIDKRDREGRNLIEIISEAFRAGKLKKDSMVNILAILRQWTISEDRSMSGNLSREQTLQIRESKEETREAPPSESVSISASALKTEETDGSKRLSRHGSSRSRSNNFRRRELDETTHVFRSKPYAEATNDDGKMEVNINERRSTKKSSSTLEQRLEDAIAERDILHKTVRKLKTENKGQAMALITLSQQLESTAIEQEKIRDKTRRRKERIEELQQELKEKGERFENHERIFFDKEQKLKGKDKQLVELSDRIVKLVAENKKLNRKSEDASVLLAARLSELEEENKELRKCSSNSDALQLRIKELQNRLESHRAEDEDLQALKRGAITAQSRLLSRIKTLERELRERSSDENDGKCSISPGMNLIENERNALKEMNASLHEHVGALKERCKQLEDAVTHWKDLQQNVERLQNDLMQARLKQSEVEEEMEHARSESSVMETRLQTKVAKLEMELLERQSQIETQAMASTSVDEEKKHDERHPLQVMNDSLKEHIAALTAKCSTLEKSLQDAREINSNLMNEIRATKIDVVDERSNLEHELVQLRENNLILAEELRTTRFEDIGERQKELHSEFNNLFNLVKGMSNSGAAAESAKIAAATSVENERLRSDNAVIKTRCAEQQSEIELLRNELQHLAEIIASFGTAKPSEFEHHAHERDEPGESGVDHSLKEDFLKELENELLDVSRRADFYQAEVKELTEKLDIAKSTTANLRELISKNNGTYMSKVELLTDEINDLRRENQSLHSHIHDLAMQNRKIREVEETEYRAQLEELRRRLKRVAGYLIALSLLLDAENEGRSSFIESRRGELRDEVERRQDALLTSDDREDIVQNVNVVVRELKSQPRLSPAKHLSGQRDEVNSISLALESFR